MRLVELIAALPVEGRPSATVEVTGVTHDSRRVEPGDLFVAVPGARFDGREFAADAERRGAVAVLGAGEAPAGLGVPWLAASDPRRLLGPLASRLHDHPDRQLLLVGVTGTNGKSTVVALMAEILEASGRPAGRLGTLGYRFRELEFPGERTTPEASDLFRALRRMVAAGAGAAAMEVSSHALELGRVDGAEFDLALFTNLTRDHLDFHPDLESYFEAKRQLFRRLKPGGAVAIHLGDAWGRRLAAEIPAAVTSGPEGDVQAGEVRLGLEGTEGTLATPRGELEFASRLVGRFNLDNMLLAVAGAVALDLPLAAVADGLARCEPLPGRLEPVVAGQPFPVFVDFAHTEAALRAALGAIRELHSGRLIVVFGCGGDRDPGKREPMGRVAAELADLAVVTSDNPRSEDPLQIIRQIEAGLRQGRAEYRIIPDRREAIRQAVAQADAGSVILIAGKGHEQMQQIGDRRIPFSDREEARAALEEVVGG